MTFYVYRSDKSAGADNLVRELKATRLRQSNLGSQEFHRGDVIVCWGARLGKVLAGVRVLNNAELLDKREQIEVLRKANVPTVQPLDPEEWIHRRLEHVDGDDLLKPHDESGFWVRKEALAAEYRVHIFDGVSIRAGVKVPFRENAHPWIRTFHAGWRINCDNFRSTETMRAVAKDAVQALHLEFGAVDVGERQDGSYLVLEVNRSPGIENENTMKTYARTIRGWA